MKKILLIFIFAMCALSGFAALPPFYQSLNEIKKILNDPRTHEQLGSGQLIVDIKNVDGGWIITTPRFELRVDVNYLPPKQFHVGSRDFDLEFHDPIEINS